MEVHGRPGELELRSESWRSGETFHQVTWTLTSFTPVTEFRLLYRMVATEREARHSGTDWTNVIIPGSLRQSSSTNQKTTWIIQNLQPESTYECLVQARNRYGWSRPSPRISFTTVLPVLKSASTQNFEKKSTLFSTAGSDTATWSVVFVVLTFAAVHFI